MLDAAAAELLRRCHCSMSFSRMMDRRTKRYAFFIGLGLGPFFFAWAFIFAWLVFLFN
jgi:hypothetical protein